MYSFSPEFMGLRYDDPKIMMQSEVHLDDDLALRKILAKIKVLLSTQLFNCSKIHTMSTILSTGNYTIWWY